MAPAVAKFVSSSGSGARREFSEATHSVTILAEKKRLGRWVGGAASVDKCIWKANPNRFLFQSLVKKMRPKVIAASATTAEPSRQNNAAVRGLCSTTRGVHKRFPANFDSYARSQPCA